MKDKLKNPVKKYKWPQLKDEMKWASLIFNKIIEDHNKNLSDYSFETMIEILKEKKRALLELCDLSIELVKKDQ